MMTASPRSSHAARADPAARSGRTQQRDVRVADCRSARCGVRAAWDGFAGARHEREQAPTASSGTAACPGVATLLLNARSRRAGCLLASTSGAPGGCSDVALAMRPMLVAQSSSFMRGARPRDAVAAAWSEHRALTPRSHAKRTQESRLTSSAVRARPGAGRDRHPDQSRVPPSTAIARRCSY